MQWKGVIFVSLLAVIGAGVPAEADACMRMKPRRVQKVDRKLQNVNRAEHLLAKGNGNLSLQRCRDLGEGDDVCSVA